MKIRSMKERMPQIVMVLGVIIAIVVVISAGLYFFSKSPCDTAIHQYEDGTVRTHPSGRWFPDMNAFHQWAAREQQGCPLPILTGAKSKDVLKRESAEQTYAQTPINKVDDFEFSRVFGYERGGRMEVPRQNLNIILNKRAFDWADKPLSSDERRAKYKGLTEGFTANGDLTSVSGDDVVREAVSRYGEVVDTAEQERCARMSREDRNVAAMVARAYADDKEYAPVLTKVGPHHWEVNELKPLKPNMGHQEMEDNRVVNTANDAVDIAFEYRQAEDVNQAIDPYFPERDRPYTEPKKHSADPYNGPVPGMERMFGPTFDHIKWY